MDMEAVVDGAVGQAREVEVIGPPDFEAFFGATHAAVFHAVLLVTRDREAAEDATGNAYLKALERWSQVAHHANPIAWVTKVAVNDSISTWRRFRLHVSLQSAALQETGAPEATGDAVRAVASLPLRQRQVVALRVLVGLDTKETAEILSMAPGTVTAHLHRALDKLRSQLTIEGRG
jgi:RNA polymerase sigma-70 factor (ECF subfamily)